MKKFYAIALALFTTTAQADVIPDCSPKTFATPEATGSALVYNWTLKGLGLAWWCPVTGSDNLYAARYLLSLWGPAFEFGKEKLIGLQEIGFPEAQAKTEIGAAFIAYAPLPGTQDFCDLNTLRHSTCIKLRTTSLVPFPGPFTLEAAQQKCVAPPVCTLSPVYRVDAATSADGTRPAYSFVNGIRGTTSIARAKSRELCKLDVAQSASGVQDKVFAAYGPDFRVDRVTLCKKQ